MNKKLYKQNGCCYLNNNNSFCKTPSFMPSNPMLANAYVPYQTMDQIYTVDTGLNEGTIFPELNDPYVSGQGYMELMELYMEGGI